MSPRLIYAWNIENRLQHQTKLLVDTLHVRSYSKLVYGTVKHKSESYNQVNPALKTHKYNIWQ